jgi:hypothetical protein
MKLLGAILVILGIVALLYAASAHAGDNTSGLPTGLGHPPNHLEYFDGNCCTGHDCEMVPDSAVQETKDGWKVRYWTDKYGGMVVEGFVKRGEERMSKKCQDGNCMGVCSYRATDPTKCSQYGYDYDNTKPAKVRCLYLMPQA